MRDTRDFNFISPIILLIFYLTFSNSVTLSTFFTTRNRRLSFSFGSISFARFSDKRNTWSQKFLMLLSIITFPFQFLILLARSYFFIALISSNDNSKRFVVLSAITINQVHVEQLKISLEHQQKKRVFTLRMLATKNWVSSS